MSCTDEWEATDLIDRQSLFSVYVNSLAYNASKEPSIFKQHVINQPVDTRHGYAQFSLVAATLKMIQAALKEPRNQYSVCLNLCRKAVYGAVGSLCCCLNPVCRSIHPN